MARDRDSLATHAVAALMLHTECDRVATGLVLYDVAGRIAVGTPHAVRLVWRNDVGVAVVAAYLAFDAIDDHGFFVTRVAMWAGQQRGAGHGVHPCG